MRILMFSGVVAALAVAGGALFANETVGRVAIAPSRTMAAVKPPPRPALPRNVQPVPLDPAMLVAAVHALEHEYPKALVAPVANLPSPVTVDVAHLEATSGQVHAFLMLYQPLMVHYENVPLWWVTPETSTQVGFTGLKVGANYLADCSVPRSDEGATATITFCEGSGSDPTGCSRVLSTVTTPVAGKHAVFGFNATETGHVLLYAFTGGAVVTGCSLYPVNAAN
jgi:hypothetical protein